MRERNLFDWSNECGVTPRSFPGVSKKEYKIFSTAIHRASDIIKNVRIIFETSNT